MTSEDVRSARRCADPAAGRRRPIAAVEPHAVAPGPARRRAAVAFPALEPVLRTVRANHPKADLAVVEQAYVVAERAHRGPAAQER